MKKIFTTLAAIVLFFALAPQGYAQNYDGSLTLLGGNTIYYMFNSSEQTISICPPNAGNHPWRGYSKPTGALVIPDSITHNGIKYPVTGINSDAFSECSGLTSVSIPNGITYIESEAFDGCNNLNSITIPSSVTSIGQNAFYRCSSLASIVIEPGNTVYDSRDNCNAIIETATNTLIFGCMNTVIPPTVVSVGEFAFWGCSGLTSITIPSSVISIGYASFTNCIGLTSVTIPNSVTSIGEDAFGACHALTSVTIPNSVTSIGEWTFGSCVSLTSVIISNSVTSIGDYAFQNCHSLSSITIPSSVTSIYNGALQTNTNTFVYFQGITPPVLDGEIFANDSPIYVPCESVSAYQSAPSWSAYSSRINGTPYLDYIVNIVTNDSSIGRVSVGVMDCDSNVTARASLLSPYNDRFIGWSDGGTANPRTFHITSDTTVTAIFDHMKYAVVGMPNDSTRGYVLGSDTIYRGDTVMLTAIPNHGYHFTHWSGGNTDNPRMIVVMWDEEFIAYFDINQYNVVLNVDTVTHGTVSGEGTFDYLTQCTITATPNTGFLFDRWSDGDTTNPRMITVTSDTTLTALFVDSVIVTDFIFADAERTMLKKYIGTRDTVVIPSTVVTIMDSAFYDRSDLMSVTIPNGVTSIGDWAFKGCRNLTSVTIPNSVTSIGSGSFKECSGLTSVTIPNSVISIGWIAFAYCTSLTSVIISSSVTNIGLEVFSFCEGLTSIVVESGNTHYDSRDNCNAIIQTDNNQLIRGCKNTVIPNSVTSIDDWAFRGCRDLTSVSIPNSVTSIGTAPFQCCYDLTSIVVESGNPHYDSRDNCNAIIQTDINQLIQGCNNTVIPNSVTSIGYMAFAYCSLTSVTIPNSVTSIGGAAFFWCNDLTSVTIPNSVISIENSAFWCCYSLTSITITKNNPPTLGSDVFTDVNTSIPIYVPCGSTANYQAAEGWSNFTNYQEVFPFTVTADSSENGHVDIMQPTCTATTATFTAVPNTGYFFDRWSDGDTTNPRLVTVTSDTTLTALFVDSVIATDFIFADAERTMLKKYIGTRDTVIIPSTVVTIMDSAFINRSDLTYVTIPQGVISIGSKCFMGCSSLTSVTIPNSVTTIGEGAFEYCSGLTSVTIPNSVTSICNEVFGFCSSLPSVTIPNSVTSIQDNAFYGCSGLISITIGSSVNSISATAFALCNNLSSITVESSNIYYDSRENCNAIIRTADNNLVVGGNNTVIPSTVTSIGPNAFHSRSGLTLISIPELTTSISPYAFLYCSGLASIVVENGNTVYDSRDNCNAIIETSSNTLITGCKNTIIPNSVTSIGTDAFWGCTGLTSVNIPNAVTNIGVGAFSECGGLTTVTFGNSLASIGDWTFAFCSSLSEIHSLALIPPILGDDVFYNVSTSIPVYLPCGNTLAYQSADGWSSFTNYHEEFGYIVSADSSEHGMVDIVQATCDNPTATLTAIPNTGFLFDRWSDGDTTNPRLITVTSDTVLTALFVDSVIATDFIFADAERTMLKKYIGTRDTVVIPSTVVSIMDSAFYDRSDLMSVTIPYGVTIIGNWTFCGCSGLTSIDIPNSVVSLGTYAFYMCSGLTSITIGSSLSMIGFRAFYYTANSQNDNLTSIVVSADNPNFDSRGNCNAIIQTNNNQLIKGCKNTVIPNTVTSIGDQAFMYCGLTAITIPEGVTLIGTQSFGYCNGLTSIFIPASVTSMSGDAFEGCDVDSIAVDVSNTIYDSRNNCNAVINTYENKLVLGCRNTVIPDDVTSIGFDAFCWCVSLTSIDIPEGVTSIEAQAFWYCLGLTSITLPSSVSTLGQTVFHGCSNLTSIYSLPTIPPTLGSRVFAMVSPNTDIYVPCGSLAAYQAAEGWNAFTNIQEHFNYTATAGENQHGSVDIMQATCANPSATYTATAEYGYHFTAWNDGNSNNPRVVPMTQDTFFTALFDKNSYLITAQSANTVMGNATASATLLLYLDNITLTATPNYGYHFTQWSDGNMDNPRTVTVTRDSVFTAQFDYNQYAVTVNVDATIHGSVSGAGSYNYLSERTVAATANYGYHFTAWSDGNLSNPRTFTLTQDTAFTALFAKNEYVLSVATANSIMGSVTGGDTAEYLDLLTIAATANYGYHFTQWNDGDANNPRTVTLTRDTLFTALFAKNLYTLSLTSADIVRGFVSDNDTAEYLDVLTFSATPNYGYHFTAWSDGDINNPRTVILTQDTAFSALFDKNSYGITVLSADTVMGEAEGPAAMPEYLDNVTLTATPNYGYHFTQWSDGNMDNPRTVTVTRDSMFTAQFDYNQYTVTLGVDAAIHGNVSGAGSYNYLSERTITATANYGYHFTAWSDGITVNPRTFTLTQDTAFTALFAKNEYVLSVATANSTMGSVTGGDTAEYLDTMTLSATANYGYHFIQWSDGSTDNPRLVVVTADSTFMAMFAENPYEVTVTSNDTVMGTAVKMPATHVYLDTVTLTATANYGYHFTAWNDSITDNPRTFVLTQDTAFMALFDKNEYMLTLTVNDAALGTVDGAGTYLYLDTAFLTATCTAEHYHFVQWSDGITDNPRQYIVTDDDTLTAIFEIDTFHVAVESDNADYGYVEGDGDFAYGAEASVMANAYEGYRFVCWSDGSTDNPYTFVVTQDTLLTATFAEETPEGIEDVNVGNISVYVVDGHIQVTLDGQPVDEFRVYDVTGRAIRADETSVLPDGVYLVKVANYPARRVIVVK